jgi:tight adherence protein C
MWMLLSFGCMLLLIRSILGGFGYVRNRCDVVGGRDLNTPKSTNSLKINDAISGSEFFTSLEAADFCDFISLVLESGGNFEKALQVGCCAFTSAQGTILSNRLRGFLACGADVVEALSAAAADAGHGGGAEVARACALSSRMGSGVGPVLVQVAETLRGRVSMALEERAARLPVLMLFPLVVFILPVIVLLLTGGAVSEFAKMLVTA